MWILIALISASHHSPASLAPSLVVSPSRTKVMQKKPGSLGMLQFDFTRTNLGIPQVTCKKLLFPTVKIHVFDNCCPRSSNSYTYTLYISYHIIFVCICMFGGAKGVLGTPERVKSRTQSGNSQDWPKNSSGAQLRWSHGKSMLRNTTSTMKVQFFFSRERTIFVQDVGDDVGDRFNLRISSLWWRTQV